MVRRKKEYFDKKYAHPYYSLMNSPNTFTLSYSVKNFSRIIFCECVLGVSHMLYVEDLAYFGQKEQFKIKISLSNKNRHET